MPLNDLWFLLISVLFTGFFFLEGFDFGVGMATRFLARGDTQRRVLINTIGPFWDANEVWLITAAGAMFAAFPHWYSTLFSGYYMLLTLILLSLIARGVAFEFRGKAEGRLWRKTWDAAIFTGSAAPPFLFGIMFFSLIQGMPIGHNMEMTAGFGDVVNGYSLWGGLTVTSLCLLHGLTFISLKTTGELRNRSRRMALRLLPAAAALLAVLAVWTGFATDLFEQRKGWMTAAVILGGLAAGLTGYFLKRQKEGWAFGMTGTLIVLMLASVFIGLFPRVMISSIDSAFDLTVANAASSPYTLKSMTIVAAVLLPFVLAYQGWSYYVFRKRVSDSDHLEY
ncbi:cytochrome d oxidase cyd, subunit II [Thermobacillus composti KWC4]|uniref:Cytochrome d oxidase cyd, subunit II n=1 Tax=Thermobacillus composti (strain DSM 18247 / JCM 13945 / KWC4) TaxID=717605 RepID=L0E9W2_THECK|nr:cytochrome d ubiquinol oxidase subunit II [Thermobacillus composti]AGA57088.1 cytochrome d oxidase cyd, subunit II [Thermobacillus composti KWC4]